MDLEINFEKERVKKVNFFWGIVFSIFALGILSFFGLLTGVLHIIKAYMNSNNEGIIRWTLLGIWFFGMLVLTFTKEKTNSPLWVNIFFLLFTILIWVAFFAAIVIFTLFRRVNIDPNSLLFIALIPVLIIGVGGLLSFFNVFNIARLSVLISAILVMVFITILISIFVYSAYFWVLILEVVLFGLITIFTFKRLKKDTENIYFSDISEIISRGIYYGTEFLKIYFNLLFIIFKIFGGSRK
ncbi:MAG0110 family membrane protein [Mycoplasmopsis canis]|uniref:Inhibitor of apoptosis-promoting Bax1 n=1 Tax=Mycoplasmopsis canis TaxID=29555 RepID=A0A449AR34_9BACT|nr:hypothetical protein [Mycoplasmopsis canis]AMD81211.1 hypothetical protein AXW82_01400 [Mycoplasmopsis canis PG 14]VEU69035.1 Uncharacterised protein [Mycoplasmopsis canis]